MIISKTLLPQSAKCRPLTATMLALLCALASPAQPTPPPSPGPQLQYAAVTGSGNILTVTRVPVVTTAGSTVFQDVTIQFDFDPLGNLTLSNGFPMVNSSPNFPVSSFQPGKYSGPSNFFGGNGSIILNGPGLIPGGVTAWSIAAAPGADGCTYPYSAAFYTGPVESSPLAPRLKKANITSNAWSYGTIGSAGCFNNWSSNTLIGASQIGNTLTIASFGSRGANDTNTPVDQVTYTLVTK